MYIYIYIYIYIYTANKPKGINKLMKTFIFLNVAAMIASHQLHLEGEILMFLSCLHCLISTQLCNYYTIILNFYLGIKFQSFLFQVIKNIMKTTRLTMVICQKYSLQQFMPHFILVGKLSDTSLFQKIEKQNKNKED